MHSAPLKTIRGRVMCVELENCIKRAVIMADGNQITLEDIGLEATGAGDEPPALDQAREDAEKRVIITALGRVDGNVLRAAEMLGVNLADPVRLDAPLRTK